MASSMPEVGFVSVSLHRSMIIDLNILAMNIYLRQDNKSLVLDAILSQTMNARRRFIKSSSLLLIMAGSLGYRAGFAKTRSLSIHNKKNQGMLRHNVYFWLKKEVTETQKKDFEKGLNKFLSSIKEIHQADIGIPASTPDRDVVDKSFGYSIFVSFKSIEDHNIYQEHPAHKVFIDDFANLWSEVKVYDSEVI
jgi:hypothetical protein